jgi:hypothetical protein
MQISKMYANASMAGEVGLSRSKERLFGLIHGQRAAKRVSWTRFA